MANNMAKTLANNMVKTWQVTWQVTRQNNMVKQHRWHHNIYSRLHITIHNMLFMTHHRHIKVPSSQASQAYYITYLPCSFEENS
jgi:hypothetical protein